MHSFSWGVNLYIGFQDRLHIVGTKIISYFIHYLSFSLLSLILAKTITTYFFLKNFWAQKSAP